ncbi:MAG: hypothetical protein IJ911_08230 [Salinivirgaceae bacterium]|nr:hypothetical protein [Salinivirgaceae bacterium]
MKNIWLLLMALALVACNGQNTNNKSKRQDKIVTINGKRQFSDKDVETLVTNFIDAILARDYQKAITYFAPEYVSLQLGDFLDNRVNQFIGEYLWGQYTDALGNTHSVSPNLDNIVAIKLLSASAETDYYTATIEIKLDNGIKYTTELGISVEFVNSIETLTLYGAVG